MDEGDHMSYPTSSGTEVNEEQLSALMELFPQFSKYQLSQTLLAYDNNIELVTNKIFEDPTIIEAFPREPAEEEVEPVSDGDNASFTEELSILDRGDSSKK